MTNVVFRKLSGWLGAIACAGLLAACGGGGGTPGASVVVPPGPQAATVVVTSSSNTIAASGADGTEVTITAIVRDANNQAVPGATVIFKASAGTVSNSGVVSDSQGRVSEKLSVKGVTGVSQITVSADVKDTSGVKSTTVTITVV